MASVSESAQSLRYALFIHHLEQGPISYEALALKCSMSYHTVIRYIKAMREPQFKHAGACRVYIAGWQVDSYGNPSIPLWHRDSKAHRDAKRPKLDEAERQRRYRANKKLKLISSVPSIFDLGEALNA